MSCIWSSTSGSKGQRLVLVIVGLLNTVIRRNTTERALIIWFNWFNSKYPLFSRWCNNILLQFYAIHAIFDRRGIWYSWSCTLIMLFSIGTQKEGTDGIWIWDELQSVPIYWSYHVQRKLLNYSNPRDMKWFLWEIFSVPRYMSVDCITSSRSFSFLGTPLDRNFHL